jgi:arylsulfatase A-like enzyme
MTFLARRRGRAALALLCAAAGALSGCGSRQASADPNPSIVIISIDTLSAGALRPFDARAPSHARIDGLAEGSVRFHETLSTASWTLPAQASLLTGLYPDRHGATDPRRRIDASVRTAAEVLRDAGYETVGFTDGGYVSDSFGFGRGFEVYDGRAEPGRSLQGIPRGGRPNELRGATLFDRATAYLERRDRDAGPLFLWVHTFAVHDYFEVHPWTVAALPPFPDPGSKDYRGCLRGTSDCPEEVWRRLRALYAAEVAHLDQGLGRLLDALVESGVGADAYVAFVADHGEGFAPALGRIHHGGRLERDLLRVPFLLAGPGLAPRDVSTPVSLVDVTPTLLALAGVAAPPGLDGRSLAVVARDPAAEPPSGPLFAMEYHHWWQDGRRQASKQSLPEPLATAVIEGTRWLIRDRDGERLYDTATDPDQLEALPASSAGIVALRARIGERLHPLPSTPEAPVDPALREQLESLGYGN